MSMRLHLSGVVLLAAGALMTLPGAASAQQKDASIVVGSSTAAPIHVQPGLAFAVPVVVDMSGIADGNLASLTTSVSWNPALARLDSVRSGRPSFGTLVQNSGKAAEGSILLSVFNGTGTAKTVSVATLYFTAANTAGNGVLKFAPSVAGNEVGKSIISQIKPRNAPICVGSAAAACPAH